MTNSIPSTEEWQQPKEVTDLEVAFPVEEIIERLCPPEELIPKDFFYHKNDWNNLISCIFYGLDCETEFQPKNNIIQEQLKRHIRTILNSYAIKHEYKIASCAYLMSQWCVLVKDKESKNND